MSLFKYVGLWVALIFASASLAVVLQWASFPAATLLGPMLTAVVFALCGADLNVPRWSFAGAQSVVGCMVALSMTPSVLATLVLDWPAILLSIVLVIIFGAFVGYGLMRFGTLPGTTAAWGTSPGGAAAMMAMAESFGADIRMVAFMQYLRIFVVVLTASAVAHLLLGGRIGDVSAPNWSPGFDTPLVPLAQTLALVATGVVLGRLTRIPGGALLLPMVIGAVLNSLGLMQITLPPWLLWSAYAGLGWYIGLRFTPRTLRYALLAIPQLLLAIVVLMVLCGVAAWILTVWAGIDPLSAYLATSPGGLDVVAIIAADSGCDVAFVLALQTLRLFAVVLIGPLIARLICRLSASKNRDTELQT